MILYKCDRCGKIQKKPFKNTIKITTEKTYGEYLRKTGCSVMNVQKI